MTPPAELPSSATPTSTTSVKARFALLLGLLLAGFFATYFLIRQLEQREATQLVNEARQQQTATLAGWRQRTERTLRNFTADLAHQPSLALITAASDLTAAHRNIRNVLANSDAHSVWVLAPDTTVILAVARHADTPPPRSRSPRLHCAACSMAPVRPTYLPNKTAISSNSVVNRFLPSLAAPPAGSS